MLRHYRKGSDRSHLIVLDLQCQTEDIDDGIESLTKEIAQGDGEEIPDHNWSFV